MITKNLKALFNRHANKTRTQVIRIAVKKGFNYWTARTQYQIWFTEQNEVMDQ